MSYGHRLTFSAYEAWSEEIEYHEEFNEAFHLFIPYVVIYGYNTGGRSGEIQITAGTFINMKKYLLILILSLVFITLEAQKENIYISSGGEIILS